MKQIRSIPGRMICEFLSDHLEVCVQEMNAFPRETKLYRKWVKRLSSGKPDVLLQFGVVGKKTLRRQMEEIMNTCRRLCAVFGRIVKVEYSDALFFDGRVVENKTRDKIVLVFLPLRYILAGGR